MQPYGNGMEFNYKLLAVIPVLCFAVFDHVCLFFLPWLIKTSVFAFAFQTSCLKSPAEYLNTSAECSKRPFWILINSGQQSYCTHFVVVILKIMTNFILLIQTSGRDFKH